MSWKATAWVNKLTGITRSEKLLMFVISDRYNEDEGCARPSIPTMAEEALMSESTAHRVIASLQRKGKIEVVQVPGMPNHYVFPEHSSPVKMTPVTKSTGVKNHMQNSNRGVIAVTGEGCHSCDTRTDKRTEREEPQERREIDIVQSLLPWLEKTFRGNPKCRKLPWKEIKWPDDVERLEGRVGKLEFRTAWMDFIDKHEAPDIFKFLREMRAEAPPPSSRSFRKPSTSNGMSDLEQMRSYVTR